MVWFEKGFSIRCFSTSWSWGRFYPPLSFEREMSSQYKVGSGLDVVVEAIDTTPYVPSFKQHTWSLLQRRKIDNWGGGQHSYIRVQRLWKQLTLKSKLRFQKKLIVQNTNVWTLPPPPIIHLPAPLTAMMSLILYKCFRTNDKDIFILTNAFSRLISLTFLYCCSTTSVD